MDEAEPLFSKLIDCSSESDINKLTLNDYDWHPLGGNENIFGVIENQQASPIAALIEEITNSIVAQML